MGGRHAKRRKRRRVIKGPEGPPAPASAAADDDDGGDSDGAERKRKVPTVQRTLDTMREFDETIVTLGDDEALEDAAQDEFADFFSGEVEPKVLLTLGRHPGQRSFDFVKDLLTVFPNVEYHPRRKTLLSNIVQLAAARRYTDIVVISESAKVLHGLTIVHLPNGPTAHFRLSSVVLRRQIPGHGVPTTHRPELMLNNFSTRLGHTVGRMLASLFDTRPQFAGRRVCTFHNQRDFIFFRQHRYVFDQKEDESAPRARIQELGPRFCLKLRWLQRGAFDRQHGDYVWIHKRELDTSRRRFFL